MKKLGMIAVLALGVATLGGCKANNTTESKASSMGAVGEKACSTEKSCCKKAEGSMGAVGEKAAGEKACCKSKTEGAMGAVSEKKSCSEGASSCSTKATCTK